MSWIEDMKGYIIFGVILFIIMITTLVAYGMTGSKGIEDRYNLAVGLPSAGSGAEEGGFGFAVEGNPILYFVILCLLAGTCFVLYRRFIA